MNCTLTIIDEGAEAMKRILIVDDNIELLGVLSSVLQQHFQVYEATGVQEAIKLLVTVTVDAICSDFNMRDGTGLEILKQLRQQDVKIPFMLMSGSDDRYLQNEAQSWGASFCCKTDHGLIKKSRGW